MLLSCSWVSMNKDQFASVQSASKIEPMFRRESITRIISMPIGRGSHDKISARMKLENRGALRKDHRAFGRSLGNQQAMSSRDAIGQARKVHGRGFRAR